MIDPALYLPFDEGSGSAAYDESGNGNHGTLYNSPTWVDGKLGKALFFNGENNHAVVSIQFYGWSGFTIVEWFYPYYPKPVSDWSTHSMIGDPWGDRIATRIFSDPSYTFLRVDFWVRKPDGSGELYAYNIYDHLNKWVHVVRRFSLQDRIYKVFVNGEEKYSVTIPSDYKTILEWDPNNATYPERFRRYTLGCNIVFQQFMKCICDELRIYSRALSETEIKWLYENSRARLGAAPLAITDISETSEPVGAEWHTWENEQVVIKRYVYGIKRTWRLSCVEKDIAWQNSAAKYLQQKMAAGETITFAVNEGDRYSLPATTAHITSLEHEIEPLGQQNIRRYTITLKEK